jgi:hypothetical protein
MVTHSRTHLPAVSVKGPTLPRGPDAASGRCGERARTFRVGRARTVLGGRPWCGSPREGGCRRGGPARSTGERGQGISERTGARYIPLAGKTIRSGILCLALPASPSWCSRSQVRPNPRRWIGGARTCHRRIMSPASRPLPDGRSDHGRSTCRAGWCALPRMHSRLAYRRPRPRLALRTSDLGARKCQSSILRSSATSMSTTTSPFLCRSRAVGVNPRKKRRATVLSA